MNLRRSIFVLFCLLSFGLFSRAVYADVIPPETMACEQKQVGDACTTNGVNGNCTQTRCGQDSCLVCVTQGVAENGPQDSGTSPETAAEAPTGGMGCNMTGGSGSSSWLLLGFLLGAVWLSRRTFRA